MKAAIISINNHLTNGGASKLRTLLTLAIGLGLVMIPVFAFAGIAGSDHDLTGSSQKLCQTCHIPHNAQGDKLWWTTPSGTYGGVMDLCYSCHDGGIAFASPVFDLLLENHATVGTDCSGDGACHDVHNQNPNTTGRFVVVTRTNNSYCETCHDDTQFPGAEGLGDHTAGDNHYTNTTTFTCNQCHTVHGATLQTTNPVGLTNPVLLADNNPSYYGMFCAMCHIGVAPDPAFPGTGGVAASDTFAYTEYVNDGTETKHPSATAYPIACNTCHDVHDPSGTPEGNGVGSYILKADNTNSAYCVSCHDGTSGPGVGSTTHYTGIPSDVNMNSGLTPPLPWANQIDEDGNTGQDWLSATNNSMVCETCHSVHRQGNTGTDAAYFLRHENGLTNQLCSACHSDN